MTILQRPPCMDRREYDAWREANEHVGRVRAFSPCHDCTAEYAAEMHDIGLCVNDQQHRESLHADTGPLDQGRRDGADGEEGARRVSRLRLPRTTVTRRPGDLAGVDGTAPDGRPAHGSGRRDDRAPAGGRPVGAGHHDGSRLQAQGQAA